MCDNTAYAIMRSVFFLLQNERAHVPLVTSCSHYCSSPEQARALLIYTPDHFILTISGLCEKLSELQCFSCQSVESMILDL